MDNTSINADLARCKYIYAPSGQALEYAPLAANPYRGCGHCCSYCYVPLAISIDLAEFNAGARPRKDFLVKLRRDAQKYQAAGVTEQVLFIFTTDVYQPFDRSLTRPSLEIIQEHGMGICVLTKGGTRALEDIDLYRPDRDCFASTLTSLDAAFSGKWEKNAATPKDRVAALQTFHERGIFTWVSLEPTIDVAIKPCHRQGHTWICRFLQNRTRQLPERDHPYNGLAELHATHDRSLRKVGGPTLHQARSPAIFTSKLSKPLAGASAPW